MADKTKSKGRFVRTYHESQNRPTYVLKEILETPAARPK
jgi:hypothetical protein